MVIQPNLLRNPYATLAMMTRQGPLGTDTPPGLFPEARAPLARRPLPGLAHAAPVLRSQLLARVERYEGLGEQITALRSALSQFNPLLNPRTSPLSLGSLSQAPANANPSPSLPGGTPASSSGGSRSTGSTGGVTPPPSSGSTHIVPSPAVMLASHGIYLAPGKDGTEGKPTAKAQLVTAAVTLGPEALTTSTHEGGKIQLNNQGNSTDFGAVTINGVRTVIGVYEGKSEEAAAQFIAKALNENAQNQVIASVDAKHGNRLVLTAKTAGKAGNITIDGVEEGNTKKGSTGLEKGNPIPGKTGETDLGEVTINGVTTRFGRGTYGSVQEAVLSMVDRLRADHAGKLDVEVGGENRDRIQLTSVASGYGASIAIDAVKANGDNRTGNEGFNGFTAGLLARGSDSQSGTPGEPGFTDFGVITINGIETVFGRLDNRDYTAATAAQFLAQRINDTNSTVRASIEDGRLKLTSTQAGPGASIRIDALAADSDGNRDNDRALGFIPGALARGSETTVTTGGSGGSGSSGSSGSAPSAAEASGSGQNGDGTSVGRAGLAEAEAGDLSAQIKEWARLTNDYLTSLEARSALEPQNSGELKAFGRTIASMMKQEESLSAVGVKVEGNRIALDEERFLQALSSDPEAALGAIKQFRDTLDPLLASQAYAMDFLREVASATRDRVPEISQAKSMQFRLEQRSKEVALHLESLEKLLPQVAEQGDRLKSLGARDAKDEDEDEDDRNAPKTQERTVDAENPRPKPWEPEAPRGLAAIVPPWKAREDRP